MEACPAAWDAACNAYAEAEQRFYEQHERASVLLAYSRDGRPFYLTSEDEIISWTELGPADAAVRTANRDRLLAEFAEARHAWTQHVGKG